MFENSNIKRQILSSAKRHKNDDLFKKFIDSFYAYIPIDDKKCYGIEEFTNIATSVYENFVNRKGGKSLVRILGEKPMPDGEEVTVVIINDDIPFLVDSITAFLDKQKYKTKHIINSLFSSDRDKDGKLEDIRKFQENNTPNESAIYVRVSILKEDGYLEKFISSIENILSLVRASCVDWQDMLKKLSEANDWFADSDLNNENKDFFKWVRDENFTFTGYREYSFKEDQKKVEAVRGETLGVLKIESENFQASLVKDIFDSHNFIANHSSVVIGKIREISLVHRRSNLDYICVVHREGNKPKKARVFIGLFSTRLEYQSAIQIPILRSRVEAVVKKAGFNNKGFNQKELFSIIETLPRDELFQLSEDELFLMAMMILSSLNNPRVLFFARENRCKVFMNLLIFFPKSRVTSDITEKVQSVISSNIKGRFIRSSLRFSIMGLAYIHISMKVSDNRKLSADIHKIEQKLDEVTKRWDEKLDVFIEKRFGIGMTSQLFNDYKKAFPTNYQLKFTAQEAVEDIEHINNLGSSGNALFNLRCHPGKSQSFNLKTYNVGDKVGLHKVMPIIQNLGFCTLEENVFDVNSGAYLDPVVIQDFSLWVESKYSSENVKSNIESVIEAVFKKKIIDDLLNQLALRAGLTWRELFLIDAYCRYMLQIKFIYSQAFIRNTLVKNPAITELLVKLFYARLCPSTHDADSAGAIEKKIKNSMMRVMDSSEDHVLAKMLELINNTLRTNFFQNSSSGESKDYVSFKFDSKNIYDLPLPKPHTEIFVYSVKMEGVHLRGGKISRGGLRWSDRVEDYRTEVLGLMKAQVTKNSIIVPEGAKGGFLVKDSEKFKDRKEIISAGIRCYKTFLRGLLDITDNLVSGKTVKPQGVICKDEDDPYLVVAADKGTATFSDTANDVAREYNFWMGDAFASGGANGYDHKKMGITARGAWVSVTEHLGKLGINPQKDEFTSVGIGDMSGDVFGNGMLLSENIKLVAAFNHMHIFLDPSPSAKSSYKERRRLFEKPGSQWSDYSAEVLSKGGAVYTRDSKSIKISKEAQNLLGIKRDSLDPDSLIRHILTAKVDLLWNGGIGTYVKSQSEANENIGNKSNDNVRVNGGDLKCRLVGEGGNLGFTQLGRVEYAFNGGMINADFIDNSAGVNCSDHEVNIKIALAGALKDKKISRKDRDAMLRRMQDEVACLVISSDKAQNQNLSISKSTSVTHFEFYVKLIKILKERVDLSPSLEFLPSKSELTRRSQEKLGFTGPELSVLIAYSKRSVYQSLIDSQIPEDEYYERYLIDYFPSNMRDEFKEYILTHQLRREIMATLIANDIVDHTGPYFFHSAQDYTGLNGCDIARAYSVVWEIFGFSKIWQGISDVSGNSVKIELFYEVRTFLQKAIFWFLKHKAQPLDIKKLVGEFQKGVSEVAKKIEHLLHATTKEDYHRKLSYFERLDVSKALASRVASLKSLYSAMDIVEVSNKASASVSDVGKVYFDLGEKLHYNWLHLKVEQLSQNGYWDRMLVKSLKEDIYSQQRQLTTKVVKCNGGSVKDKVIKWINKNAKEVMVFTNFIDNIKSIEEIDSAKLVVAIKQSEIIIK